MILTSHLARIFYLGKEYYGSQWQSNVRTIQGEIMKALSKWSGTEYTVDMISFSGRTDKGVNSIGQIVQFESDHHVNLDKINRHLPDDIVLWAYLQSPENFNPRFGVLSRHYRYYLLQERALNLDKMTRAAQYLIGINDFALLSKPDDGRNTIANLLNIAITQRGSTITFDVFGIRFLWKLVRKIVTLLTAIGKGEYPPEIVSDLLSGHRVIPGGIEPASPDGLVLVEAIVPFRLKPNRNALAMIQKTLGIEERFHRRAVTLLDGLQLDIHF